MISTFEQKTKNTNSRVSQSKNSNSSNGSLQPVDTKRIIQILRTRLKETLETDCQEIDDETLHMFLRVKQFDVERAIFAIERNKEFREKYQKEFSIPLKHCKPVFESGVFSLLREKHNGQNVAVLKVKCIDSNIFSWDQFTRASVYCLEELLQSEEIQTNGITGIIDFSDVGWSKAVKIVKSVGIYEWKKAMHTFHGGPPLRITTIFGINFSVIFTSAYNAVKYILGKKVRERMRFTTPQSADFLNYFDLEKLPESMGGVLPEEQAWDNKTFTDMVKRFGT